jgi:hypothetical protein
MAIYGQFNNYRGPQQDAQAEYAQVHIANNGNPNGANNVSPTSYKPGSGNAPAPINPQSFMSDYAIRQGGQRPELARYVAPQLDPMGNPVPRDMGGYSYNAPNSFGNGGVNARFRPFGRSQFNPNSQQPGGLQGIMAQIRQRLQREPTGMPRFGQQDQPWANDSRAPTQQELIQMRQNNDPRFEHYAGGGLPVSQPVQGLAVPSNPFNSGMGPPAPVPTSYKPGMTAPPLAAKPPAPVPSEDINPPDERLTFRQRAQLGEFRRPPRPFGG